MAAKKIIGYDAMGNPIYAGSGSPGSGSGIGSGTNTAGGKASGVGSGTASGKSSGVGVSANTARVGATTPSKPKGSVGKTEYYQNLQGAPTNTARSIKNLGAAPTIPTVPELEAIRKKAEEDAAAKNGKGGDPYASLLKALTGLGDYAAGNINSSMDTLMRTLGEQSNPYANFQAQQTATTPELSQLLQSQGVSQDPLQQYAAAINAQNMGQANAFQNQANAMRDIYGASQRGSIQDVAQQRADLLNQLQGNVLGAGKTLFSKKAPQRNSILNMILEAMKVQR